MTTASPYSPFFGASPTWSDYPSFMDILAVPDPEQSSPAGPSRTVRKRSSSPKKVVSKACDQCHVRKLKCDGGLPCTRCKRSSNSCTFLKPVLPKGPAPKSTKRRKSGYDQADLTGTGGGGGVSNTPGPSVHDSWGLNFDEDVMSGIFSAQPTYAPSTSSAQAILRPAETHDAVFAAWTGFPSEDPFNEQWNTFVGGSDQPAHFTEPSANSIPSDATQSDHALDLEDLLALTPSFESELINTADQLIAWQNGPPTSSLNDQSSYSNISVPSAAFPFFSNPSPLFPSSNLSFGTPEDMSPLLVLTLENLIKPQLEIFFDRIYSMMPVFSRSDIFDRLARPKALQDKPFVALILSMTALSLVHPLQPHEMSSKATRGKQATMMMDEACTLTARWDYGCTPTIEGVLTSYLMFGTLFELGYQDGARLRLREAISLGESMRIDQPRSYIGMNQVEARRRMRMFWILAVTERAYALQRAGHLVFQGSIDTHLHHNALTYPGQLSVEPDPVSHSLRHLAFIFSHIDQTIISCWNGKCSGSTCTTLTTDRVVRVLQRLQGSAEEVFGLEIRQDLQIMNEVQKADLLITWQWIRNRIWRLAAIHGLTSIGGPKELSPDYILDVGEQTVEICKTLSFVAMEAHGTGFVEKLFDVASVVAEALRSVPNIKNSVYRVQAEKGIQTIQTLFAYVARHRAGTTDFAAQLGETVKTSMKLLTSA